MRRRWLRPLIYVLPIVLFSGFIATVWTLYGDAAEWQKKECDLLLVDCIKGPTLETGSPIPENCSRVDETLQAKSRCNDQGSFYTYVAFTFRGQNETQLSDVCSARRCSTLYDFNGQHDDPWCQDEEEEFITECWQKDGDVIFHSPPTNKIFVIIVTVIFAIFLVWCVSSIIIISWTTLFRPDQPPSVSDLEHGPDGRPVHGVPACEKVIGEEEVEKYLKSPTKVPDDACSICLEMLDAEGEGGMELMELFCSHSFHRACITKCFTTRQDIRCPLCSAVPPKEDEGVEIDS